MSNKVNVKVLGERNSGTNLFHKILKSDFNVSIFGNSSSMNRDEKAFLKRSNIARAIRREMRETINDDNHFRQIPINGGWKHSAVTDRFVEEFAIPNSCLVLCIVRHPVAWANSMHKSAFHSVVSTPDNFSEFISSPWIARYRDELSTRFLESPLQLWQAKVESYVSYANKYDFFSIIKYEDLVLDSPRVFSDLSRILPNRNAKITVPEKEVRWFRRSATRSEDYVEKIQNTSFDQLSNDDNNIFKSTISDSLIRHFGYS